jgi:hypothetical protein
MKITWNWSIDSEAERVLDTAGSIGNGFFALQGFCPLPWGETRATPTPSAVYLPKLAFHTIPHFWSQVAKLDNRHYPLISSRPLTNGIKKLLQATDLEAPSYNDLEHITKQTLPKVLSFVKNFIPKSKLPTEIIIHPTNFGTGGSFSRMDEKGQITIYLRFDKGIKTIVECVLTSMLRQKAIDELSASWSETEFLTDWLIRSSALTLVLPPDPSWEGTLNQTRQQICAKIQTDSINFLKMIGAPTPSSQTFKLKNNQVYFESSPVTGLTLRESTLISKLIDKAPAPITLDEVGSILFTNDEKFSLAAISKTVERLRTKFATLGISPHYLATASGVGYYLKN